ncbi:MAG: hypothetical protein EA379_07545 [Phycisphaerales bacterium]|nr:MAG: hypothetical protein EA379_07545 [Phycisphaerales bacterium]
MKISHLIVAAGAACLAGAASAQWVADPAFNSKSNAQSIQISAGSTITGNSTAQANGTYFLAEVGAAPLAIYRHRLVFESDTLNQRGWIKGLQQTASGDIVPDTDVLVQATSLPATKPSLYNQWYGFGKGERFYYQVFGTAATTADYTITMDTEVVTPDVLGSFLPGQISISTIDQGHTSTTHIHVYDANLNPIPGYSNIRPDSSTFQSLLTREYDPGTYYLAIGLRNTANDQATPDDTITRNQPVMDFGGMLINGQPTAGNQDVSFSITDGIGTYAFDAERGGNYGVYWATFTIVPTPGSAALLGVMALLGARRRRA